MERNTECFILLFVSRMGAEKRDHFCLLPSSLSSFFPLLLPSIPLSFFPPFFLCFQYHWVFFFFLKLLDLGGHPPRLLLLWSKWSNWQPLGFLWPELFPSPGTGSHPLSNLCGCLYILPLWQTILFWCVTGAGKGRDAGRWGRCPIMIDPCSATDQQNYTP